MSSPLTCSELDLESLPTKATSKVLVELITDGLGQSVCVPLLVARGQKPGPVVGITAAVHGNELNGIAAIHHVFETLHTKLSRGTVVGVVAANVPGLHQHQREYADGVDLNDIFPGRVDGNASQTYARRLIERVIRKFDTLLDLHTASFGRVNSLYVRADMTNPTTARMAYLQKPEIILHNRASDGTLRGAAMEMGIPAITLEIADPQRFQPKYVRSSVAGIHAWLSDLGMKRKRSFKPGPNPVLCDRSYWIYTDRGGLLEVLPKLSAPVAQGELIARLRDAFGTVRKEYHAPEDGVVIGKSVNPVGPTGARILHLGIVEQKSQAEYVQRNDSREHQ